MDMNSESPRIEARCAIIEKSTSILTIVVVDVIITPTTCTERVAICGVRSLPFHVKITLIENCVGD